MIGWSTDSESTYADSMTKLNEILDALTKILLIVVILLFGIWTLFSAYETIILGCR